jgi:hypothetical protein
MSLRFGHNIDLAGNMLLNARVEVLASLPGAGSSGRLVYNSANSTLNYDNGSSWVTLGTAVSVAWNDVTGKPTVFPTNLANITDMSAFIRTLADDADAAAARLTLGLGTAATQAATAFAALVHSHGDADITALSATKLTGTIDPARLPVLPSSVQIVASSNIASLTAPQQAEIGDGSVVTTTDGRRWIYTGSGSKTLEASYIELADITPEWTAIANRPATFAPSAHGHTTAEITGLDTALAARPVKFAGTGPSAGAATWAVDHNLNTTDVVVSLYEIATNEMVLTEIVRTSVNRVTVNWGAAVSANSHRIVVMG